MKPLLTVPIQAPQLATVQELIDACPQEVQAVEIWIDYLPKRDRVPEKIEEKLRAWKKASKKKLIVVCKDAQEKGRFKGSPSEKVALLLAASRGGAHYIDVGLHLGKAAIATLIDENKKAQVIISHHDFEKTPSWKRLQSLVKKMQGLTADVVKIASMVHDPQDAEYLMQLALDLKKDNQKHIIIGMGQLGITTRVFAKQLGNELNFVTLDTQTAPGQLSLEQMIQFQKVLD